MRFRKKPVEIEAVKVPALFDIDARVVLDDWLAKHQGDRPCRWSGDGLIIATLEGEMRADVGDWIIRGVKGELYPCKPDIFEATYDDAGVTAAPVARGAAFSAIAAEAVAEAAGAAEQWPPFNSAHEAYAVLAEEVDELWDEVKVNQRRRDVGKMRAECVQVAAMALRFAHDICNEEAVRK